MSDDAVVEIDVDGRRVVAERGATVAAALMNAGIDTMRRSLSRQPRGVLCGMGVCQECRATIDDVPHRRACATLVAPGMRVRLDAHD